MLFLLFKLGNDRYVLDASRVVEVVPLLDVKRLANPSPGVAGVFNYHGQFVTAVDLCDLMLHRPAEHRLSTRIIIIKQRISDTETRLLGLIAEEATGMLRKERADFTDTTVGAVAGSATPVLFDALGAIHLLDENHLLSDSLRNQLAHVTA